MEEAKLVLVSNTVYFMYLLIMPFHHDTILAMFQLSLSIVAI